MNNIKVLQAAANEYYRRYLLALDRLQRCNSPQGKKALETILFKRADEMEEIFQQLKRAERRAGIKHGRAEILEIFRNN